MTSPGTRSWLPGPGKLYSWPANSATTAPYPFFLLDSFVLLDPVVNCTLVKHQMSLVASCQSARAHLWRHQLSLKWFSEQFNTASCLVTAGQRGRKEIGWKRKYQKKKKTCLDLSRTKNHQSPVGTRNEMYSTLAQTMMLAANLVTWKKARRKGIRKKLTTAEASKDWKFHSWDACRGMKSKQQEFVHATGETSKVPITTTLTSKTLLTTCNKVRLDSLETIVDEAMFRLSL